MHVEREQLLGVRGYAVCRRDARLVDAHRPRGRGAGESAGVVPVVDERHPVRQGAALRELDVGRSAVAVAGKDGKVPAWPTVNMVVAAETMEGADCPGIATVMSSPPSVVMNGHSPAPSVP